LISRFILTGAADCDDCGSPDSGLLEGLDRISIASSAAPIGRFLVELVAGVGRLTWNGEFAATERASASKSK
jgi:hypothetical protein